MFSDDRVEVNVDSFHLPLDSQDPFGVCGTVRTLRTKTQHVYFVFADFILTSRTA